MPIRWNKFQLTVDMSATDNAKLKNNNNKHSDDESNIWKKNTPVQWQEEPE